MVCSISILEDDVLEAGSVVEGVKVGEGSADTFLPLVEDGRTGMVDTVFFRISELLATAFVNAFLSHAWTATGCCVAQRNNGCFRDTPRIETIYWLGPRDPLTSESVEGQTWGRHGRCNEKARRLIR